MAKKSIIEAVGTFFSLALALPIWFYLLHWLLKTNGAGELHMFLFWIYIPVGVIGGVLTAVVKAMGDE